MYPQPADGNPVREERERRARAIASSGGIDAADGAGVFHDRPRITVAEGVVLGLLRQGVRSYVGVLGHGSTELGDVLRTYEEAGLVRTFGVRSEIEAAHAATALRWVTGEKAAVVTSIGPGALQALAASLAPASNGIGVWHIYGDETTEDEGPNMQQVPKAEQGLFLQLCSTIGHSYSLHTPAALGTALRRGLNVVDHPHRAGPFHLLLPINTQPAVIDHFTIDALPAGPPPRLGAAADGGAYKQAAAALLAAEKVVVKLGGGAREAGPEVEELLDLVDGVAVCTPVATGILAFDHPRYMTVGGTKGSISGNFAMENADVLLAVGTRAVCQSDCSRTGYRNVRRVVNVNTDVDAAMHYGRTTALVGDAAPTLRRLIAELRVHAAAASGAESRWLSECRSARRAWDELRTERYRHPVLFDEVWGTEVLTQPAAVKAITDLARERDAVVFFDSGDVQANGFQVTEDDRVGRTFTETGASYMGFAPSALLATAIASEPFDAVAVVGDGSFTMNPQILIDGAVHGATGCIVVLDNRRMGAISSLQLDQYGLAHATADGAAVDYCAWARASGLAAFDGGTSLESLTESLDKAFETKGLTLVHVPVYFGPDPLGGLGTYGRWNVGNWVGETQRLRHEIGL